MAEGLEAAARSRTSRLLEHESCASRSEAVAAAVKAQSTLSLLWDKFESRTWFAQANPERTPPAVAELLDAVVNRCFEIQMDGASAELIGPIVELDPRYSYGLEASVQCVGLNGHRVWLEIELLDDNLQVVHTAETEPLVGNRDWTRLNCVIAQESGERFRAGRVRIVVQRNQDRQFRGIVRIDDIRINRVPRLDLKSNLKLNVAQPGQEFEITCTAIGISGREENPKCVSKCLTSSDASWLSKAYRSCQPATVRKRHRTPPANPRSS